jgi:hypothetical protein
MTIQTNVLEMWLARLHTRARQLHIEKIAPGGSLLDDGRVWFDKPEVVAFWRAMDELDAELRRVLRRFGGLERELAQMQGQLAAAPQDQRWREQSRIDSFENDLSRVAQGHAAGIGADRAAAARRRSVSHRPGPGDPPHRHRDGQIARPDAPAPHGATSQHAAGLPTGAGYGRGARRCGRDAVRADRDGLGASPPARLAQRMSAAQFLDTLLVTVVVPRFRGNARFRPMRIDENPASCCRVLTGLP